MSEFNIWSKKLALPSFDIERFSPHAKPLLRMERIPKKTILYNLFIIIHRINVWVTGRMPSKRYFNSL
jgi:hypothetical protein